MLIAPNVHRVRGLIVNSYLLEDDDGLTLIDAGVSAKKVLSYLGRIGRASRDIVRIIITHADPDHYGGLAELREASGATVYAHPVEAAAIEQGGLSRELKPGCQAKLLKLIMSRVTLSPAPVDEHLRHGQELPVLGGLQVVDTPGHTPGHVSLFSPLAGVLFCGDSIQNMTGRMRVSRGANTWDEDVAKQSMEVQCELRPQVVCPGHGPVVPDAASKFPR